MVGNKLLPTNRHRSHNKNLGLYSYQGCLASIMYQTCKFRIYPTPEQQAHLSKAFGCCRWFWNYSLNLCQETYKTTGKSLSRASIQGLLPELKKEYTWLKTDVYSQCLQVVALNLYTAYKNFFEKRSGFPSLKSKHGRQSISFPQNVKLGKNSIKLPKLGEIYCRIHRPIEGTIKTVTISQNPDGKYYASILVGDGKEQPLISSEGKAIGIDVGVTHFCITSDGSKYSNPKHFAKHQRNLKRKQQKLSRKEKGSKRRNKARITVALIHSKIARCREDFLHKLSRKIVNENQVIVGENLNIKGMVRNHNLAKAISDCGWGMFQTMLKYKAEREGKIYLKVDIFFPSSKTCNHCLHKVADMPLDIREWICPKCGTLHDRDVNAAKSIRDEGLRILSLGTSDTANGGNVSRTGKTSVLLDAIPCEVGSPDYAPT